MDYQPDKVRWLLENEQFRQWVFRPDDTLRRHWQTWLAAHPDWQDATRQAQTLLMDIRGELPLLTDDHIDRQISQLVTKLERESIQPIVRPLYQSSWRWVAAASVALLLGAGWWYRHTSVPTLPAYVVFADQPSTQPALMQDVTNAEKVVQTIRLPDSSFVKLQPGSRLRYPLRFTNHQRDVYLTGEAFFEVSHDSSHPFWVHAPGLNTKVLGTSFRVKAYASAAQVSVTVRTGRVSVYANTQATQSTAKRSIVLTPNQQAVLSFVTNQLTRSLVAQPAIIPSPDAVPSFVFRRTPISTVLKRLEQAYGVTIVYNEQALQTCTLTASLGDESLWEKLRWICAGTGSTYEVIDGQIVLESPGCSTPDHP